MPAHHIRRIGSDTGMRDTRDSLREYPAVIQEGYIPLSRPRDEG